MLLTLVSQELSCGQSYSRSDDTLNSKTQSDAVYLTVDNECVVLTPSNTLGTFQYNLSTAAGYLRWVISQVQEQTYILHGTVLLKVLFEEPSCLHVHLKCTVCTACSHYLS